MSLPIIAGIAKMGLGIIDQLVVDKDKKAAIEHRKLDKQKDDPFWFEE